MKKEELIEKLNELGVHPSSYSLGAIKNSDCVCVVHEGREWNVYYVERDKPSLLSSLSSEEEAYSFLFEQFKTWLS